MAIARETSETTERAALERRFSAAGEQLTARMRALRDPVAWPDLELTMPQLRALGVLSGGERRMSELAGTLGTSLQATTSLIDRLVDKGLVERRHDTADRRVVRCRLAPAGEAEVERVFRIGQARLALLRTVMSDDELALVTRAFEVLAEAALRMPPPCARAPGQPATEPDTSTNGTSGGNAAAGTGTGTNA